MENSHDQNILADNLIDHDVRSERMKPHRRREFIALARRAGMSGEKFEYSLKSGMVFFRLRQSKLRRAATKNGGDVSLGRFG